MSARGFPLLLLTLPLLVGGLACSDAETPKAAGDAGQLAPDAGQQLGPCAAHTGQADCCAAGCMWLVDADGDVLGCFSADTPECERDEDCDDGQTCDVREYGCDPPDACAPACQTEVVEVGYCR